MNAKNRRKALRALHLAAAAPVVAAVYAGASAPDVLTLAVRIVILPALAVSGLVMWQLPRIRRRASS